ncbi:MAG: metallophosphoesterase, partial [Anaerolinea sp.]|nr:metallophosphoesterase [Anaerolinea sp.]
MKWNELPVLAKDRLVMVYESVGLNAVAEAAELVCLDITTKSLQRRIQEHRKFVKGMFEDDLGSPEPEPAALPAHNNHPPSALTDIRFVDLDTDQGEWVRCLHRLASEKRVVTVMHLADVHFPFQHGPALKVTYQLISEAQPDVIVVGSDAFDFAMLSRFAHDADLNEESPDVLKEILPAWREFILRVRKAAPNAVLVWIWGNHDQHLVKYLNDEVPKFRLTLMQHFIDLVRCGGEVLYVGYTDYVRIGPLVVQHGYRTGLNAAKNHLVDAGGQISTMAGHVHRTSDYEVRGEDFIVRS